jgi:hypothetical protein
MRKVIFLIFAVTMVGLLRPALGGTTTDHPAAEVPAPAPATLDQRFEQCMKNPGCSAAEQSQLIEDISNALQNNGEAPQRPQKQNHLRDMMQALETGDFAKTPDARKQISKKTAAQLDKLEPAAGSVIPKSYTNPGQEQIDKEKLKWGQSWAPEDVSNPYHKW